MLETDVEAFQLHRSIKMQGMKEAGFTDYYLRGSRVLPFIVVSKRAPTDNSDTFDRSHG